MKTELQLRALTREDWPQVAALVYLSTNYWYRAHGRDAIFSGDPSCAELFPQVYEALDPGCCVVAQDTRTIRRACVEFTAASNGVYTFIVKPAKSAVMGHFTILGGFQPSGYN